MAEKNMTPWVKKILDTLYGWIFGFWVTKWRVTMLLLLVILLVGGFSVYTIPKESSPDIEFGIISITTPYIGVNPVDIDQLITQEIEKEIQDVEGIKKITSNSVLWVSSVVLELETDSDTSAVLVDVKDAVEKVNLPDDANDPVVTEITTSNTVMFDVILYAPTDTYSQDYLLDKALVIKNTLEGRWSIASVDIGSLGDEGSADVRVLIDQHRLETLWLSIFQVTQAIRSYNQNQPIGNFEVGNKTYDFRIQAELDSVNDLLQVPLPVQRGVVTLGEIATIDFDYGNKALFGNGLYEKKGYTYVKLTFNKEAGANIFSSSDDAKERFVGLLQREEFSHLQFSYVSDLSEAIREDYKSLAENGWMTIVLVFLCLFFFVWFKESIIASITIPLAFLITFVVLNWLGLSLNFLTNFSLIITFGIAIDVTIVIVEWAHEKMRLGFDPKAAVLLAVRDYKWPLIAGTSTTLAAFLPMLNLPGVTGKFLAYIPITIFSTLVAALFLALTINSALYFKFSSKKNYYTKNEEEEKYIPEDERELLAFQRIWKEAHKEETLNWRDKMLVDSSRFYENLLGKILDSRKARWSLVIIPFVVLIASFMLPIGSSFFPASDNPEITISVKGEKWIVKEQMLPYLPHVEDVVSQIPEMKIYTYSVQWNTITLLVELYSKNQRDANGQRNSFEVEEEIIAWLEPLQTMGLKVETDIQSGGPPQGKALWIKLIADNTNQLAELIQTAKIFEQELLRMNGTRNVGLSTDDSPWQFVFSFNKEALAQLWLTPSDFTTEVFARVQWLGAGTIKGRYEDHDVKVIYKDYVDKLTPSEVQNIVVPTKAGPVRLWTVLDYDFENAIDSIKREDTKILVRAEADVMPGMTPDALQADLLAYAQSYDYPEGISYEVGWENAENSDVIAATWVAWLVALILIYSILVLTFNSYGKPAIIMYSVVMGLLGANIGLFVTWNPYSMAWWIWFIALTWIVVNDAIVLIDRINKNVAKWMEPKFAAMEAGKARLHPIILTTITTILGLMSVALEDEFFAWLAYTIMFGLFVGSAATLFVIPVIYFGTRKRKSR